MRLGFPSAGLGFPSAGFGFPSGWLGFPSHWLVFPSVQLGNPASQPGGEAARPPRQAKATKDAREPPFETHRFAPLLGIRSFATSRRIPHQHLTASPIAGAVSP